MRMKLWHVITTVVGLLALLAVTVFVLSRWHALPEQISTHFDAAGRAESFGGKGSLITLLATGWIVFLLITVLSFFPQTWNVSNRSPQGLRATANMLAVIRLIIALMFSWMIFCTSQSRNLGLWFMPVTMTAVFGTVIAGLIATLRK